MDNVQLLSHCTKGEGCLIPVQFRNNVAANISSAGCHEGTALVLYCSNPVVTTLHYTYYRQGQNIIFAFAQANIFNCFLPDFEFL